MITRNSNSPPPPTTMLAQTMVIGPQTNIVNGEGGGNWEFFEKSTNYDCSKILRFSVNVHILPLGRVKRQCTAE